MNQFIQLVNLFCYEYNSRISVTVTLSFTFYLKSQLYVYTTTRAGYLSFVHTFFLLCRYQFHYLNKVIELRAGMVQRHWHMFENVHNLFMKWIQRKNQFCKGGSGLLCWIKIKNKPLSISCGKERIEAKKVAVISSVFLTRRWI